MALRKEKLESFRKELTRRRDTLRYRRARDATERMINDDVSYADSIDQASADTDRTPSTCKSKTASAKC